MNFKKKLNNVTPPFLEKGFEGIKNDVSIRQGGMFLFIILILVVSCSNPYKNLPSTPLTKSEITNIPYALPYLDKAIIYKADISFYKNDIGGLLIFKKTENEIYRIALTTQFGLKIFDFELNQGKLKVMYCADYLKKKVILNTLETDFNLLLMQNQFESLQTIANREKNQKIWQLRSGKVTYNYIEDINSQQIVNIRFKKRKSEKISVGLCAYQGDIPGKIKLEHHNIKLKMDLKLIQ